MRFYFNLKRTLPPPSHLLAHTVALYNEIMRQLLPFSKNVRTGGPSTAFLCVQLQTPQALRTKVMFLYETLGVFHFSFDLSIMIFVKRLGDVMRIEWKTNDHSR